MRAHTRSYGDIQEPSKLMISAVPLPNWSDLLSCGGAGAKTDDELAAPWRQGSEQVRWFSRSAWSLKSIVEESNASDPSSKPVLWLPDYFCNQSTAAFRGSAPELRFYPVGGDLNPDWKACQELAEQSSPPDLFVLVHYFGHPADGARALAFCRDHGARLIEDGAHVLTPTGEIGRHGDYCVYSPHKHLAIPDGALLLSRTADRANPTVGPAPSAIKWMIKRCLQKVLPSAILRRRHKSRPGFGHDPAFAPLPATPALSTMARRLLIYHGPDFAADHAQRLAAAEAWSRKFAGYDDGGQPLFDFAAEGSVPYRFVVRYPSRDLAERRFDILRQAGIPVETWPDLAPEVLADPDRHAAARAFRDTLLFLPVHVDARAIDALVLGE